LQGTWVHPRVGTYMANWISPYFAVKISLWIEEWKTISKKNEQIYFQEYSKIYTHNKLQYEKQIQEDLCIKLNGQTEVKTPVGYIDILTENEIIEIKQSSDWKHAIGQIISYGTYYPSHKKVIYLFGMIDNIECIQNICDKYNIEVRTDSL
jgi:hypothetical protein